MGEGAVKGGGGGTNAILLFFLVVKVQGRECID